MSLNFWRESAWKYIERKKKESKNPTARDLCGTRSEFNVIVMHASPTACIINEPWELGYTCPLCGAGWRKRVWTKDGELASGKIEALKWGEYAGFLWCSICNFDIPSILCLPQTKSRKVLENRIASFLEFIDYVNKRAKQREET